MTTKTKMKIKKGDEVMVMSGKDKGKKGNVIKVVRASSRVLVQGVNMAKRHTKPSMTSAGGIEEIEAPLHVSNVAIVDPKTGEATKVGFKTIEGDRKVRFAKKSGEIID